jgi:hypothetical protein
MRAEVQSQRDGDAESFSPRSGCAMIFQKSRLVEAGQKFLSSASTGSLINMDASPFARKAHAHETHAEWLVLIVMKRVMREVKSRCATDCAYISQFWGSSSFSTSEPRL